MFQILLNSNLLRDNRNLKIRQVRLNQISIGRNRHPSPVAIVKPWWRMRESTFHMESTKSGLKSWGKWSGRTTREKNINTWQTKVLTWLLMSLAKCLHQVGSFGLLRFYLQRQRGLHGFELFFKSALIFYFVSIFLLLLFIYLLSQNCRQCQGWGPESLSYK